MRPGTVAPRDVAYPLVERVACRLVPRYTTTYETVPLTPTSLDRALDVARFQRLIDQAFGDPLLPLERQRVREVSLHLALSRLISHGNPIDLGEPVDFEALSAVALLDLVGLLVEPGVGSRASCRDWIEAIEVLRGLAREGAKLILT
jgi:hypothetical protein